MKKVAILLLIVISLFSGCSKKKDSLDKSHIDLYVNEHYQLKFKGDSDMPIRWSSEDNYVAEVTNLGEVIANKVGQTTIYANNAKCKVNVIPKHNIYDEPITKWGLTKNQVISLWGEPDLEDSNLNMWAYYEEDVEFIMYYFDRNNQLYCSSVILYTPRIEDWRVLINFLNERYVLATYLTSEEYDLIYINDLTLEYTTTIIGVGEDVGDIDCSLIDYIDINAVNITRGDSKINLNLSNREEIIKNFLNKKKSKE